MGANKTLDSIKKITKAVSGFKKITENLDDNLNIYKTYKTSARHTIRSSKKDEKAMLADILPLDVFNHVPNRYHNSFPSIKSSPMRYLRICEFHQWLDMHCAQMIPPDTE